MKNNIIICDTREKGNQKILEHFDKVGQDYIVSKLDAGRVCDTWAHIQYVHLFCCPIVDIVAYFWSWTHETHITYQHVDELG